MRMPVRSRESRSLLAQVVTFGGVSVTTTLLDFGLFNLLVFGGLVPAVLANTVSYGSGMVVSYLLNKHLTFAGGGRDKQSHEIGLFVVLSLGGLALNNLAVGLVAALVGGSPLLLNGAKLAAGGVTWLFKFVTFKRWVYPVGPQDGEPDVA